MIRLEPRAIIIAKLAKSLFDKKSENTPKDILKEKIRQFAMRVGMQEPASEEELINLIHDAINELATPLIIVLFRDEIEQVFLACLDDQEQAKEFAETWKCAFLQGLENVVKQHLPSQ